MGHQIKKAGQRLITETRGIQFFIGSVKHFHNRVRVDCHEGPPVPIPNTEVKLMYADDTWRATAWENK